MWAVVPATLNSLSILIYTCTAGRMAEIPSFLHHTSAQEILRSVANLSDFDVEEVFLGIGRMPQISSVVLDRMAGLLTDIFEDSRDVLLPCRSGRVTRSSIKAGTEDARTERCEEDSKVRSESENERTTVPVRQSASKVHNYSHTTPIQRAMFRTIIFADHMAECSNFLL